MPTLEPWVAGLTMSGSRSRSSASSKSCGPRSSTQSRRGHPDRLRQALGAQLVHADRRAHHAAAGVGNARDTRARPARCRPRRPGRAARSTPARSAAQRAPAASARADRRPTASTPRRASAASTASPERSEISRSLESPPSSTATRPNSRGSADAARASRVVGEPHQRLSAAAPADDAHLGLQTDAVRALHLVLHVRDQLSRRPRPWPRRD